MAEMRKFAIALLCLGISAGCGDEESTTSFGPINQKSLAELKAKRKKKQQAPAPVAPKPVEEPSTDRPAGRAAIELSRESFAGDARDPFENAGAGPVKNIVAELPKGRQRDVRFRGYNFEDLRLIAIVRSGKRIPPRALFVASDGVSKSIQQGEYFSRNEILLASVNSDYVEIEIVDEELAQGLNMEQGERRAIYLKQD